MSYPYPHIDKIFSIAENEFESIALDVFRYQAEHIPIYKEWLTCLHIDKNTIHRIDQIPFLPISFFKNNCISINTEEGHQDIIFSSSGTTGNQTSKHFVKDLAIYEQSFNKGFHHFYGPIEDYCILALLPAYLERKGSSLVYMADHLISKSKHAQSGFYLNEWQELKDSIDSLEKNKNKYLLLGVSFALWEFSEQFSFAMEYGIIMETGGMKGRRKEITRSELHFILQSAFGLSSIHSEYGMTELLSQAYSDGKGIFRCPPWLRVQTRSINDPFEVCPTGKQGLLQIIDLANIYSSAFIETQDIGIVHQNGSFEILGRYDLSEQRGCNLMVSEL